MSNEQPWDVALPGMPHPPEGRVQVPARGQVVNDNTLEPSAADIERFNAKVVHSPTCWFWTGAISSPDGYGRFTWQQNNAQRTMLAHRFALLVAGERLDVTTVAEHACNEPLCVRVDDEHVHRSTQAANLQYAVRSGRHIGNVATVDSTHRALRSLRIRDALAAGWDADAFRAAITDTPPNHPTLF